MAVSVTDADLSIIERMAGLGSTLDDIAHVLGWSGSTLDRKLKLPKVKAAYQKGRALAKEKMQQRLWDIAMSNDSWGVPTKQATTAAIFWLKSQAGWSDRTGDVDMESEDQKVVIYLPDNGRNSSAS